MSKKSDIVLAERIAGLIYFVRGQKVMFDEDLAKLYNVETGNLNKAIQRNQDRFPDDFCFRLTLQEYRDLKFQFGRSRSHGGRRKPPYVFTEQGVAMLSSVLSSERAIEVNIAIMRTFVKL
ncbi:MAG: ORF6N domain-containing protein [Myxococcota bacterium]|nr:ORF6N domain-containing protein [Myxococcota bacterium]